MRCAVKIVDFTTVGNSRKLQNHKNSKKNPFVWKFIIQDQNVSSDDNKTIYHHCLLQHDK